MSVHLFSMKNMTIETRYPKNCIIIATHVDHFCIKEFLQKKAYYIIFSSNFQKCVFPHIGKVCSF